MTDTDNPCTETEESVPETRWRLVLRELVEVTVSGLFTGFAALPLGVALWRGLFFLLLLVGLVVPFAGESALKLVFHPAFWGARLLSWWYVALPGVILARACRAQTNNPEATNQNRSASLSKPILVATWCVYYATGCAFIARLCGG